MKENIHTLKKTITNCEIILSLKMTSKNNSDVSNINDTTSLMIQNVIYGYLEYGDVEIVAILIESRIPLRLTLKVHIYLYQ